MLKRTGVHLEASAIWDLFYGEPGANLVELCLSSDEMNCLTSVWTRLEVTHAVKKRMNQEETSHDEGRDLLEFIDTQLGRLTECPVTEDLVSRAREIVVSHNLYASDALHLATAFAYGCKAMLVDDYHFRRSGRDIATADLCISPVTL